MDYEIRIVAFLDILGFKAAIDKSENAFETRERIYNFINEYCGENLDRTIFRNFQREGVPFSDDAIKELLRTHEFRFSQFSDSFIFSVLLFLPITKMLQCCFRSWLPIL